MKRNALWVAGGVFLLAATASFGDITVPGADGSDGPFVFAPDSGSGNTMTIDLSLAPTAAWDAANPNTTQGKGVYDANKWAVVFRYSGDVTIPSGKTVTFKNHPSGAPVVWLVAGNVSVAGVLDLNARNPSGDGTYAACGPGGFRGGKVGVGSNPGSHGFGPGGGNAGGSYATIGYNNTLDSTYGNAGIGHLVGGSGGTYGGNAGAGGGGGGGALLVAASNSIMVSGTIQANGSVYVYGGYYGVGGSGGAIRLVANTIGGGGFLRAVGGASGASGGDGRIRLEANTITLTDAGSPTSIAGQPGPVAKLWPDTNAPRIMATTIGGQSIPADPRPLLTPVPDVTLSSTSPVTLHIEAVNVPNNWIVTARIVPLSGNSFIVNASLVNENGINTVWEAPVTLINGLSAVYVRARKP